MEMKIHSEKREKNAAIDEEMKEIPAKKISEKLEKSQIRYRIHQKLKDQKEYHHIFLSNTLPNNPLELAIKKGR